VIVDRLSAHKTAAEKSWLAEHPKVYLRFTPTHSSSVNQLEIWLDLTTPECGRGGTFKSAPNLGTIIMVYILAF
jgi:hypothetical protein